MKKLIFLIAAVGLAACQTSPDIVYKPAEQKLPIYIKRIAVRPFANKTQQFGLEEKITLKVIDEFLKNGEYLVSPENAAQGVIVGEISHYILTPIQYDVNLVPTVYKLNVIAGLRLLDREQNRYLWEEPALQVTKMYSAANLPGGLTEEQAREALWEILAKDVVLRTVSGFGSVSSASQKKIPGNPEVQQSSGTLNGR
ncbi:MAG: LPS assembly lipoprotein LptE [Elusimicrobiales bacterium]|nr:LPS assembly lipoprotein LptE [Elusimicrobiales bacterium]